MLGPGDSGPAEEARAAADPQAAAGRVHIIEQALWRQLSEPAEGAAFCGAWLALLCRTIPDAKRGVLLLGEPDDGPPAGHHAGLCRKTGMSWSCVRWS
jgi:hypothetical protein